MLLSSDLDFLLLWQIIKDRGFCCLTKQPSGRKGLAVDIDMDDLTFFPKVERTWGDRLRSFIYQKTGLRYRCVCGHRTPWFTELEIGRQTLSYELTGRSVCYACWLNKGILCPLCGLFIPPGMPIALYVPTEDADRVNWGKSVFQKDPLWVVGCSGCADKPAEILPAKAKLVAYGTWEMTGAKISQFL